MKLKKGNIGLVGDRKVVMTDSGHEAFPVEMYRDFVSNSTFTPVTLPGIKPETAGVSLMTAPTPKGTTFFISLSTGEVQTVTKTIGNKEVSCYMEAGSGALWGVAKALLEPKAFHAYKENRLIEKLQAKVELEVETARAKAVAKAEATLGRKLSSTTPSPFSSVKTVVKMPAAFALFR